MSNEILEKGTLYLVGTPIGNLEDMTLRAIRILQSVDLIAAEDTRHTGKLLHHFQITTPQISYHHHNRLTRQTELLEKLQRGQTIALVTDAGMPGICDPGYDLTRACIEVNIPVIPIPGATAAITALSASGLPSDRFVFEGFLPTKDKLRRDRLSSLQKESRTLIFYEAPHRLLSTLTDLAEVFGKDRSITVARELTKLYEQLWRGTLEEGIDYYQDTQNIKGEITLVVRGCQESLSLQLTESQLKEELLQLLKQGMTRSQASRQLAQLTARPRREIYELSLSMTDSYD
ncbi:16S rRNA (cytidine(1402)-2'-O)-methyltransferase [Aphanothece sacrum]|uniref:Ribosomal RNA small subunit methyltransferase I n=1 Tax=Aphanothece sacrum FPU1 TaxID=1920663 RepID=A0A401ID52_APHSA|nr:16S rRNA (cytidine(1402)-2'-O)-methyltransferase [Aphanothece sacrum]GBF79205.1 ribosomal RNA small subunit methyltransferase I [Aphanothece sacrum FPU1]GBF86595.1 ribosomal RNA small subunit methyltransferase I [Aphanothece sacrum FPU3]